MLRCATAFGPVARAPAPVSSAAGTAPGRWPSRSVSLPLALLQSLDSQRLLRWLLAVALVSLAAVPAIDPDLFWHLANGRWILHHGIPTRDFYSFSANGQAWVVHEWLADVGAFALDGVAGYAGLILAAALAVAAGFGFAFALQRNAGAAHDGAVGVTLVSALAASTTWGPRPQVFNFLLLGALTWWLFRYRAGRGSVIALPLLFLLWANLHSGFVVGLAAALLFAATETIQWKAAGTRFHPMTSGRLKRLWVAIAAGALLSLLNPAGIRALVFPLGTLGSSLIQQNIAEWASPDFHTLAGVMLALLIALLIVGPLTGRVRADLTEAALAVAFLALALTSSRHVPLFTVAGAPLLGRSLGALERTAVGVLRRRPSLPLRAARPFLPARPLLHALVLVLGAAVMLNARLLPNLSASRTQELVAARFPVGASAFLATEPPRDLFNYYDFGGYLVWTLAAHGDRVFIDGRVEVYGDRILAEYLTVNRLQSGWQDVLARYRVRTVIMPVTHPLVGLLQAAGWEVGYRDAVAAVVERKP